MWERAARGARGVGLTCHSVLCWLISCSSNPFAFSLASTSFHRSWGSTASVSSHVRVSSVMKMSTMSRPITPPKTSTSSRRCGRGVTNAAALCRWTPSSGNSDTADRNHVRGPRSRAAHRWPSQLSSPQMSSRWSRTTAHAWFAAGGGG